MHVQSRSHREIAEKFGLSKSQAKKDLRAYYKSLEKDRDQKRLVKRDRLLAEIGLAKRELWEAWHRSKEDKEVQTKEKVGSQNGGKGTTERTKASIRSEGRLPQGTYMAELGKCWDREAKLLGLNNPDKVEVTPRKPIQFIHVHDAKPNPAAADKEEPSNPPVPIPIPTPMRPSSKKGLQMRLADEPKNNEASDSGGE